MKIQCVCGTKVAFDITPDMAARPVQFVCPSCGLDSSAMVNQLIRQELGVTSEPVPIPIVPTAAPAPAPVPAPAPKPVVRVAKVAPAAAEASGQSSTGQANCLKHRHMEVVHHCLVCGKPMCLDCMALFGYVCSPLCRNKAEARDMDIPVYAQQKSVIAARQRRKVKLAVGTASAVVALVFGVWFWYAWFGSVPKVAFSMKFADSAEVGAVQLCGNSQLVYLHGGVLGRIDMNKGSSAWTQTLVDKSKFGPQADQAIAELTAARERYLAESDGDGPDFRIPSREEMMEEIAEDLISSLHVHVVGENIWVMSGDVLTRYDWQTGEPGKEIKLEDGIYGLVRKGDELVRSETSEDLASETTLHINLASGEVTKETVQKPVPEKLMALLMESATNRASAKRPRNNRPSSPSGGSTVQVIGADDPRRPGAPLDPQKIAAQASAMSLPAKLALPVLIANARNQQRLEAELNGDNDRKNRPPSELEMAIDEWESTRSFTTPAGPVLYSATLVEYKMVAREAMKPAPKESALDGNVSAANSMAVANEMLNEMQRELGSTVLEDMSRYRVSVKRSGAGAPVWTSEVVGPPSFHPLETVNIITAGANAIALDSDNKELWKASLNYSVPRDLGDWDDFGEDESDVQSSGLGPCAERNGTVFIFDEGSLAAFDRNSGEARWRLPSVGIAGLWFDDKGMIYVNTSTASPDKIRYSKQIDFNDQAISQILKVDPKSGKTIWSRNGAKHICYMWKDYIYTADASGGIGPDDALGSMAGINFPAFVRIQRIDAGSGRVRWVHVQKRFPIAVSFHENTFQLMFKNEVQNLKFLAL